MTWACLLAKLGAQDLCQSQLQAHRPGVATPLQHHGCGLEATLLSLTGRPCERKDGSRVCAMGPSGPSKGPAGSTKSSAASVPALANSSDLKLSQAACTCTGDEALRPGQHASRLQYCKGAGRV